jgi:S1-C subfamily serine protease
VNLLDAIIIVAAIAYGIGGFRSGALVGIFSLLGFFGGAAIGAQVAQPLGSALVDGRAQVPVAIFCVLVLATLGQLLGVYVAGHVRSRVVLHEHAKLADSGVGAVLGVLAVLLVAWMVALPLANSPYPSLAAEASHSTIVRAVNGAVPDSFRNLYRGLRKFLDRSGFPPVFGDLPSTSNVPVAEPPANLGRAARREVREAAPSVLKIFGQAPQCGRSIEGSGFVYAPHRVLTNAHVVAGTDEVTVEIAPNNDIPAEVVLFDPDRDVAVLDVPDLPDSAQPLPFSRTEADSGDPALVLGYPENGPFTVRTARIRSEGSVGGTNIYGKGSVDRSIYAIRSVVRSGNSGGPLLGYDGTVLGMVFATAIDSPDTGFALTDAEIGDDARAGRQLSEPVGTGACTPD